MTDREKGIAGKFREAADWFVRLQSSALKSNQLDDFEKWLTETANAKLFDSVADAWSRAGKFAERKEILHMRDEALAEVSDGNRPLWRKQAIWASALTMVVSISLGLTFLLHEPNVSSAPEPLVYATAPGELLSLSLSDGSVVDLDSTSKLTVSYSDFSRELTLLEGRANFEVAKDHLRPFFVRAGNKLFVAKGTEFSIELINGDVRAILYEGRVAVVADKRTGSRQIDLIPSSNAVAKQKKQSDLIMEAGDRFVAGSTEQLQSAMIEKQPEIDRTAKWREGRLEFVDEPLSHAITRMNRYSHLEIKTNLSHPASIRVSGSFAAGKSEAFAEGVAKLHDLTLEKQNNYLILSN